jgi:hypothetical protein
MYNTFWEDKAYGSFFIYKALSNNAIKPILPPSLNAALSYQK